MIWLSSNSVLLIQLVHACIGIKSDTSALNYDLSTPSIVIGTCETSAAVGLVLSLFLLPSSIGTLAAFLILPIMAGALYLHHVTNTPNDNALIVTGLCFLRLILDIFRPSAGKAKAK